MSDRPTAPRGWYADQNDSTHERYWDGERWTDARRPVEAPAPQIATLPPPTLSPPSSPAPLASGGKGPLISYELRSSDPPLTYRAVDVVRLSGLFAEWGYKATSEAPQSITFSRQYSPGLFIALYILLFPIGLLFLLVRPTQSLVLSWWTDGEQGTIAEVHGQDKRLASVFDQVEAATRRL